MGKLLATAFALALLVPFSAQAQQDSTFTAWLETMTVDGKTIVSGWCQNNSAAPQRLRYRAVMNFPDGSADVRENTTLALPRQPTVLLKAVFAVPDGGFESVELDVFQNEKIVASAILRGAPSSLLPSEQTDTPAAPSDAASNDDLEIEGLILDETRSKLAHDFYELFYNSWTQSDSAASLGATIVIREMPARTGLGARITVEVDGQELSQLNLQPRLDLLEELAAQLAEALKNFLENPDDAIRELEAEEMQGTGIY